MPHFYYIECNVMMSSYVTWNLGYVFNEKTTGLTVKIDRQIYVTLLQSLINSVAKTYILNISKHTCNSEIHSRIVHKPNRKSKGKSIRKNCRNAYDGVFVPLNVIQ